MPTDGDASAQDDERLFDAYLDQALSGELEDPARFCRRHGIEAGSLVERLTEFFRAAHGRPDLAAVVERSRTADVPRGEGRGPDLDTLPFEHLGEFRLLRRLGSGGMGMVFLAEQPSLSRTVAIKLIRPELRASPRARERFLREAHALARLRHPGIVSVLAVGEDQGVDYLVMERVPGRGLDQVLDEVASGAASVPLPTRVGWVTDLARALAHAHDLGLVHRDVKPSNVRLTPEGRPVLLDFGLARDTEGAVTLTAGFVGSPAYAAPEQLRGDGGPVDGRADVYALGVLLYQVVTGTVPFRGDGVEQVLQRILFEVPRFPRGPGAAPRDLQLVALAAMEKDRDLRYASARDLANDLEAVLELRPVSARAPGPWRRLLAWRRRRPGLAAAVATGAVALMLLILLWVQQGREFDRSRREAARQGLADARGELESLRAGLVEVGQLERQAATLQRELEGRYLLPEESRELDRMEGRLATARRERERAFHAALDAVDRALRLDPDLEGTEPLLADLHLQRWLAARLERDEDAAAFYLERVEEYDDGRLDDVLHGWHDASIRSDPPGAELFLFRREPLSLHVPGAEPRLVNVPWNGWPEGVDPAAWALELLADAPTDGGAPDLLRGDLVLAVDGRAVRELPHPAPLAAGAPALVFSGGRLRSRPLPPGLAVRRTAAPLYLATPLPDDTFRRRREHLVVYVRQRGFEPMRLAWNADDRPDVVVALHAVGTAPPGFRFLQRLGNDEQAPFWIQEREVTSDEYLAFLNDPGTLMEMAGSSTPIRVPRNMVNAPSGGHWPRGEDGRYGLPAHWPGDWPVQGVSHEDASAFARWRTAEAAAEGRAWRFSLPTPAQWKLAGAHPRYVWGEVFRPHWTKSNYATPRPVPEPVLSYPIDESALGVFDLAGSVSEWLDGAWIEGGAERSLAGGSWAFADPDLFGVYPSQGHPPDFTMDSFGFRLVMTLGPEGGGDR